MHDRHDDNYVMLLDEKFFKTFITKQIADTRTSAEVLVCLSCDSRKQVDDMIAKAISVGAKYRANRKTTASCTARHLKIWTGTSGK